MISVCILTKNSAETLTATLASTGSFSEVVLLDNGSTDATLSIASRYPNVKIFETSFKGFGRLRNEAAVLAQNDWICALDSDEVLSSPLLAELSALSLNPTCAYSLPRHNFYNGKQIKGCGWYPERLFRLYHRNRARFSEALVHESLLIGGLAPFHLQHPIFHTPYRSTADFLAKLEHYSALFAQEHQFKRRSSVSKALSHSVFAFFRSYFLKRGFLDGAEGFIISFYNANVAFYKYLKLAEANRSSLF